MKRYIIGEQVTIEETRHTEFKEVKGINPVDSIKNVVDEYAVAFLNAKGGSILWGIRDSDRAIVGVTLASPQRDELRRVVTEQLTKIQPAISPLAFQIILHETYEGATQDDANPDLYIVEVVVSASDTEELYFTGSNESFIKTEGGKKKLTGPELSAEIRRRLREKSDTSPNTKAANTELTLAEFIYFLDWVVSSALAILSAGPTFGESRRILALTINLHKRVQAQFATLHGKLDPTIHNRLQKLLKETMPWFFGEANLVLPHPGEDKFTQRNEHFDKAWDELSWSWCFIRDKLLETATLNTEFLMIKADDVRRWPIIGFANDAEYREYVSPTFFTLSKSSTPIQRELLSNLASSDTFRFAELEQHGFAKDVVVETVNCLLRSNIVSTHDFTVFFVSSLGKKLIFDFLNRVP